jgi:alpha-amylase/alpha-mannosidase (GH57 family)
MKSLITHGHFYQPPRENPWTGEVDAEPSAAPFHDWNQRVTAECYQPNSGVHITDENGIEKVVNNYGFISFDFGPTLLSWLEREQPETYARIIAADAESASRHSGHGNAIAQAYGHAILPLCNERDMRTQVRWGLADFRHRFKREAEAIWLPETACNDEVMGVLIDEGTRFVILAPQQAGRTDIPVCPTLVKAELATAETAEAANVDTSIAYRYLHRDGSNRSIAVFFYDHELAGAIAFERALTSSKELVDRFDRVSQGAGSLVNVATDGESYGHHHKFGDLCLAYALEVEAPRRGFSVTNYGEYLDQHPPAAEVEVSCGPENQGTSWSCVHGVSRWTSDCGCSTGGDANWNQAWRRPLRAALDFLRDQAALHFEATRGDLFIDPWAARDDSIELVLNPERLREQFLYQRAPRSLSREEETRALLFLEMQRNTLLMYASCGWFFNDISGIEPIQILKYAGRVIDLMDHLGLPSARERFLEILAEAKSNRPEVGTGTDIYRRMVEPARDQRILVNS